MAKIILLVRHGHSEKNLKDVFGGNGLPLTESGKRQVSDLIKKVRDIFGDKSKKISLYASCKRLQVVETAKLIQKGLEIETIKQDKKYRPIKLGIFDSSSIEERKEKHKDILQSLKEWEAGERDILDVSIPESEDVVDYFGNIKNFIDNLPDNEVHILVGTRSDLSAIKNYACGNHPEDKMTYKFFKFDYTEVFSFMKDNEDILVLNSLNRRLSKDMVNQNEKTKNE